VFWKVQVLKQDISTYRLRALAPLISGTVGVEYMRKAFSTRYQLAALPSITEASQLLPRTVAWFKEGVQNLEQEKAELEASLASVQGTMQSTPRKSPVTGLPPPSSMRTGGRIGVNTGLTAVVPMTGLSIPALGTYLLLTYVYFRPLIFPNPLVILSMESENVGGT
jgi:hypothetical protein